MPGLEREVAYLNEVAATLRGLLGADLVGVYAGGSYALGGYEPGRGDLDVAAVTEGVVSRPLLTAVAEALDHAALACPARGLELVVYPREVVRAATAVPGFLLNLNTGGGVATRLEYEPAAGEGHWFGVDRAVLAAHGLALFGPPARAIFVPPPRAELLRLLASMLRWYLREASDDASAVPNACRALHFARESVWIAKAAVRARAEAAVAERGGAESVLRGAVAELEARASDADEPPRRGRSRP